MEGLGLGPAPFDKCATGSVCSKSAGAPRAAFADAPGRDTLWSLRLREQRPNFAATACKGERWIHAALRRQPTTRAGA